MLTPDVIVLDGDKAVGIVFAGSELNIAPLQRDQLTAPQAGAYRRQKQRIIFGANVTGRFEELPDFGRRQGNALCVRRLGCAGKASQACGWLDSTRPASISASSAS